MATETKKQISEANSKCIALFAGLITVDAEADEMRKALNQVYVNYTRFLIKSAANGECLFLTDDTETGLYYLAQIIEILEWGY